MEYAWEAFKSDWRQADFIWRAKMAINLALAAALVSGVMFGVGYGAFLLISH